MAPLKPKAGSTKGPTKRRLKSSGSASGDKSARKAAAPPARTKSKPQQSRPARNTPKQKKKRVYTEKELGVPQLNMITPKGVQKPRGKKKGKVFVDDPESMMTLLAMVNAEKDGQIESKVLKARHLEELREARQREMEAREENKKAKFEETKQSLRRGRKSLGKRQDDDNDAQQKPPRGSAPFKKRVSFG